MRKGFRVVVPDMLGYGGTDKPADASEYSTKKLTADLAALLDLIGVESAVCSFSRWGTSGDTDKANDRYSLVMTGVLLLFLASLCGIQIAFLLLSCE